MGGLIAVTIEIRMNPIKLSKIRAPFCGPVIKKLIEVQVFPVHFANAVKKLSLGFV